MTTTVPPCPFCTIAVSGIAAFSCDGRVYRAFDHLVAARSGTVLLVPLRLVAGDLTAVVDLCPVPWAEVHEILYGLGHNGRLVDFVFQAEFGPVVQQLAALAESGWWSDDVTIVQHPDRLARRFTHELGMRYAVTPDLVSE